MRHLPQNLEALTHLRVQAQVVSSANEVPLESGTSNLEQGREKKVKVGKNLFLRCRLPWGLQRPLAPGGGSAVSMLRADDPRREGRDQAARPPLVRLFCSLRFGCQPLR